MWKITRGKATKKNESILMDFAVSTKQKMKVKENKKVDFVRELKNLLDIKITMIPIVSGALGTVLKNKEKRLLERGMRGKFMTI